MEKHTRPGSLRPAAAAACLLLAIAAAPAAGQKEKPDAAAPAYVDLTRVLGEYRKTGAFARYQTRLRDQAKMLSEEMQALAQLRYCSEEERKEALVLKAKAKPSAREMARLADLMGMADKVENEIAALSQKAKPTPEETKRLQELSQKRTEAARGLAREEADRRDALRKAESDAMAEVENELLALIAKVAKDAKLTVIYERRAVLFGGSDLTETVIKKLPR